MNGKYALLTVGVCLISLVSPALAGQPDIPQEKRDLVQFNIDYQQAANGPSGFGKRISSRATDKTGTSPFRNFGDYLQQMTDGPDPANDSGGGND